MVTSPDYPYLKIRIALRSYEEEMLAYIDRYRLILDHGQKVELEI